MRKRLALFLLVLTLGSCKRQPLEEKLPPPPKDSTDYSKPYTPHPKPQDKERK